MTAEPYTVHFDRSAGVLEARLAGFWSVTDRRRFGVILQRELADLRRAATRYSILFDLRGFEVQSAANIDAMVAGSDPASPRERAPIAVVTDRALLRRQASRVLNLAETRTFDTREAALAWLAAHRTARWDVCHPSRSG